MSDPVASSPARLSTGRWTLTLVCAGALLLCGQVRAGEAAREPLPELGLEAPRGTFGLYESRAAKRSDRGVQQDRLRGRYSPDWRRHYFAAPWPWYAPPSLRYRGYPPPVYPEPRLGLLYRTPGSGYDMGIQIPVDEEPIETYSLGPYRGIVRSPQRPEWLYRQTGQIAGGQDRWGIGLMRQGKHKAAGRLLARGFRDSDDPSYPLYLAEALFGLGKYKHAELVLRHALRQERVFELLPEDVASHFPSRDAFEGELKKLTDSNQAPLLAAYLSLFSKDGSKGLDMLMRLMDLSPDDEVPAKLYRHFLGKAFGAGEGETPEKGAEPSAKPGSEG